MRNFVILVILAVLGLAFLVQKRQEEQNVASTPTVPTHTTTSPRPVSEHNWMKRSLDTTKQVTHKVAEQRKEDGTH